MSKKAKSAVMKVATRQSAIFRLKEDLHDALFNQVRGMSADEVCVLGGNGKSGRWTFETKSFGTPVPHLSSCKDKEMLVAAVKKMSIGDMFYLSAKKDVIMYSRGDGPLKEGLSLDVGSPKANNRDGAAASKVEKGAESNITGPIKKSDISSGVQEVKPADQKTKPESAVEDVSDSTVSEDEKGVPSKQKRTLPTTKTSVEKKTSVTENRVPVLIKSDGVGGDPVPLKQKESVDAPSMQKESSISKVADTTKKIIAAKKPSTSGAGSVLSGHDNTAEEDNEFKRKHLNQSGDFSNKKPRHAVLDKKVSPVKGGSSKELRRGTKGSPSMHSPTASPPASGVLGMLHRATTPAGKQVRKFVHKAAKTVYEKTKGADSPDEK